LPELTNVSAPGFQDNLTSARGIETQAPSGNDTEIYGRQPKTKDMTTQFKQSFRSTCTAHFVGSVTVLILGLTFLAAPLPAQTLTTLHAFAGGTDGALPFDGVVRDDKGNLYGTTGYGGDPSCNSNFTPSGCGTVYKLDPAGRETILHAFTGASDGQVPTTQVLLSGNNLYGTTSQGGDAATGTVFELNPKGQKIARYSFQGGTDASSPFAGLIQEGGAIFGTGYFGGTNGDGAVFALNCSPAATCREVVLHSFVGGPNDGSNPNSALVRQSSALVGSTVYGGSGTCNNGFAVGCGTVYKLTQSGETLLHTFKGTDGTYPGVLIPAGTSGFYGITGQGGSSGNGTVFHLSSSGVVTTLYSFMGGSDGAFPGGLIEDSLGHLFGTTYNGGATSNGTIFELSPNGQGAWTETVLYSFTNGADGGGPQPGIVLDQQNHTIYGSTVAGGDPSCSCGTVFSLSY
jgi:uncharacterized repeat protein (TIGR03803 family)